MVNGRPTGMDALREKRIARGIKRLEAQKRRRAKKPTAAELARRYRLYQAGLVDAKGKRITK